MKRLRIAVSQRYDIVETRDEARDALDVRLTEMLWDVGFLPLPIPSSIPVPTDFLTALEPDGILLSGGNSVFTCPSRDTLERAALHYAAQLGLPVLGICRGMQFINCFQGGSLRSVSGHVAERHIIHGALVGESGYMVNSYHDQAMFDDDLGCDLEGVAWACDGVVEGLRHRELPWLGIMWHPEREAQLSALDRKLIFNCFKMRES